MSRTFKESGIDWIGIIPSSWNVKPLKHVLAERKEQNKPITETHILSLTNTRGVIPYSEKGDIGNKSKDDLSGYKIVRKGDIVINSMNLYIGSVGLSNYVGVVSPVYYMLYNRNPNASIEYYNLLFQTKELQSKSHGYGNGILDIRMRIPMSKLNLLPLPVPPAKEQHRIVEKLKRKIEHIESLIKIKEKQIEILKEFKQAVIRKAVTKGLFKNVPMKDSGQYMIGLVPNNWKLCKIKHVVKISNGKEIENDTGDVPVYGSGGVFKYTNKPLYSGESVLLGRKGTIDKPQYVEGSFWTIDTAFYTQIDKSRIIPKFFYYISLAEIDFGFFKSGSVKPSMTQSDLNEIYITLPPLDEQKEIIDFLTLKESYFERIENCINIKIQRLHDYKNSLIYEYTTGKKEAN